MRVAICSKRDLTSMLLLNDLLPRLAALADWRILLLLAVRTREVELRRHELARMKFLERDLPFDRLGLDRLPALPGAGGKDRRFGLDALAAAHGAVSQSADSWPAATEALTRFQPDLILSVRFSFRFREPVLSLCKYGIINVHPGALPEYAGLYPHFYSMLAGEKSLGCTLHYVDESIDSGPVLATGSIPVDPRRSAFAHNLDSHLLGNRLLAGIAGRIAQGRPIEARPRPGDPARTRTYPTEDEFTRFRAAGLSLIHLQEYMQILRSFGAGEGLDLALDRRGMPAPVEQAMEG